MGGLLVVVLLTASGCSSAPRLPECRGPWREINPPVASPGAPAARVAAERTTSVGAPR